MSTAIQIRRPAGAVSLPDLGQWKNRFQIRSESSNRIYVIAQNKDSGLYGCSCPGYLSNRKCKHLTEGCGLPLTKIHGRNQFEFKKRSSLGG
jgi:hypothetical protein